VSEKVTVYASPTRQIGSVSFESETVLGRDWQGVLTVRLPELERVHDAQNVRQAECERIG